jgi:hypothetical protein
VSLCVVVVTVTIRDGCEWVRVLQALFKVVR